MWYRKWRRFLVGRRPRGVLCRLRVSCFHKCWRGRGPFRLRPSRLNHLLETLIGRLCLDFDCCVHRIHFAASRKLDQEAFFSFLVWRTRLARFFNVTACLNLLVSFSLPDLAQIPVFFALRAWRAVSLEVAFDFASVTILAYCCWACASSCWHFLFPCLDPTQNSAYLYCIG